MSAGGLRSRIAPATTRESCDSCVCGLATDAPDRLGGACQFSSPPAFRWTSAAILGSKPFARNADEEGRSFAAARAGLLYSIRHLVGSGRRVPAWCSVVGPNADSHVVQRASRRCHRWHRGRPHSWPCTFGYGLDRASIVGSEYEGAGTCVSDTRRLRQPDGHASKPGRGFESARPRCWLRGRRSRHARRIGCSTWISDADLALCRPRHLRDVGSQAAAP